MKRPYDTRISSRKRSERKRHATPHWLTSKDHSEIESFYMRAKKMIEYSEVDHIVPLQGNNVCGLHVPWNLQILSRRANLSKGNR